MHIKCQVRKLNLYEQKDIYRHFLNNIDRSDSSGFRFFLSNQLRQYDLGYLTFGTDSDATALAIPPQMDRLAIDSYCPAFVTQVLSIS